MNLPSPIAKPAVAALALLLCLLHVSAASAQMSVTANIQNRTFTLLEQRYGKGNVEPVQKSGNSWFRIRAGQYAGACDSTGREVIAPDKYDHVRCMRGASRSYFEASSLDSSLCTIIASDGTVIIPCGKYSALFDWERIRGKIYFIAGKEIESDDLPPKTYHVLCDEQGHEVIPAGKYTSLSSDGLYIYAEGEEGRGVCDIDGREIVPCRFHFVKYDEESGVFQVKTRKTDQWQRYNDHLTARHSARAAESPVSIFERDRAIVRKFLNEDTPSRALEYLKAVQQNGVPARISLECDYAVLMQEIIIGLGKAQGLYLAAMDTANALVLQTQMLSAEQIQNQLLVSAASKGDQRAVDMIRLKSAMTGGGNNNAPFESPNNGQASRERRTCSMCSGRGWIAGTRTPTYGNTETHWCSECRREVPASHSHDRCPSCDGRGTR